MGVGVKLSRQSGYTLIEAMTVLVIVSVTVAVSFPVIGNIYSLIKLRTSAEMLVGILQTAKMKAVNENTTVTLTINETDKRYQISGEAVNFLDSSVSFESTPPSSIVFNSLGRLTSGSVTLDLIGRNGSMLAITINPSGRISIN